MKTSFNANAPCGTFRHGRRAPYRPSETQRLVLWLICENDRLRCVVRELEKRQTAPFSLYKEYEHE